MRSFTAVVVVFTLTQAFARADLKKNIIEKCKTESKATEDILDYLERGTTPVTKEGKCMLACLYEETGIVKEGKLDMVKVESLLREDYANTDDLEGKISMFMEKCAKPTLGMEKCEAVAFVHSCEIEYPAVSLKSLRAMWVPKTL